MCIKSESTNSNPNLFGIVDAVWLKGMNNDHQRECINLVARVVICDPMRSPSVALLQEYFGMFIQSSPIIFDVFFLFFFFFSLSLSLAITIPAHLFLSSRRYFLLEAHGVKCWCPRCAANFGRGGDVPRSTVRFIHAWFWKIDPFLRPNILFLLVSYWLLADAMRRRHASAGVWFVRYSKLWKLAGNR